MAEAKKDTLMMGPKPDEGGRFPYIRRRPDGTVIAGFVGPPCRQGAPMGDALCLRHEEGLVFEVVHEHRSEARGPAKVTTDAYRSGWDNLFGNKAVGEA